MKKCNDNCKCEDHCLKLPKDMIRGKEWAWTIDKTFVDGNVNNMNVEADDISAEVSNAQKRKGQPVYSGVLKYFPNALKAVAECSKAGNDQHHPDKPLHWDMSKSSDEKDALVRHLIDHSIDPMDTDGILHLQKVAWRALAALERYLTNKE